MRKFYNKEACLDIFENGEIYNRSGRLLKHSYDRAGYPRVYAPDINGKRKGYFVHRLLAQAFIPNHESKPEVNHKNAIKNDYSLENLEWCTHAENLHHAKINRLGCGRPRTPNEAKRALCIKFLYESGKYNTPELAQIFGLSVPRISAIMKSV